MIIHLPYNLLTVQILFIYLAKLTMDAFHLILLIYFYLYGSYFRKIKGFF